MKRLVLLMIFSAAFAAMFVSVSCHAQVWVGRAVPLPNSLFPNFTTWEAPGNWDGGRIPDDSNTGAPNSFDPEDVVLEGNALVAFDAASWNFVRSASGLKTVSPVIGEFWGMGRLQMGTVPVPFPTPGFSTFNQAFEFDHGGSNVVNFPNPAPTIIGEATGNGSGIEVASGIVEIRSSPLGLGGDLNSSGTIRLSGGELRLPGNVFNVADDNGSVAGEGEVIISGGAFSTGGDVIVGGNGTFEVVGSSATLIDIGSDGTGNWTQRAGGVLRVGLDGAGMVGFTPIEINGDVTFESGAILDPFDAGAFDGFFPPYRTVMRWTGMVTDDGLALSPAALGPWTMRIVGNELQVRNPNLNGITTRDCTLLRFYQGNIGMPAVCSLSALDLAAPSGTSTLLTLEDAEEAARTLVVTSNGVTGTFLGDFNCDGRVSVIPDAFTLIAGLGRGLPNDPRLTYLEGDIDFDGTGTVLGDAFIFVANLGQPF